uniref:F-box domain-containing protein n=1 Tax=Arundo donax TaxID=35708 RepID=A0A0A8XVX5_ARUDO
MRDSSSAGRGLRRRNPSRSPGMASSKLCSGLDRRVMPARAASDTGVLPLDVVYEILIRLPAKLLCRLRTVCRPWRSLLSDPQFAAVHAVRHPEPLIIVGYNYHSFEGEDSEDSKEESEDNENSDGENVKHKSVVHIMDLSGHIVKEVDMDGHVTSVHLNLVSISNKTEKGCCRLVNPGTGAMYHVPENREGYNEDLYPFGQVATTGEYKMLQMGYYMFDDNFKVCTLNNSSHIRRRFVGNPPLSFEWYRKSSVVIDGVVYFLSRDAYYAVIFESRVIEQDWIVSFDLETERWRPNIRGPGSSFLDNSVDLNVNERIEKQLSLANLNGSLVIVHGPTPCMDLWCLMDFEKSLWVKQYSIQIERYGYFSYFCPLVILDDGRIVIHTGGFHMLRIHDPRTNNFSNGANLGLCCAVSVYTGNLLSLER